MAKESQVWLDLVILGLSQVLEVVKNVHLPRHSLRSDDIVALRHVPGSVDLSSMVYLFLNLYPFALCCSNARRRSPRVLEVPRVLRRLQGNFDLHYLNVVLLIIRSVGSNE